MVPLAGRSIEFMLRTATRRLRRAFCAACLAIAVTATLAADANTEPLADYKKLSDTFDTLLAARKMPEAATAGRELMRLSEQLNGPQHPTTLDTMMWLANVLEAQAIEEDGRAARDRRPANPRMTALREEAIALLKRRFDMLVASKGLRDDGVKVAQARLVNLLRSVGRKAEAAALVEMQPGGAKTTPAKPNAAEAPTTPASKPAPAAPPPAFTGRTEAELRAELERLSTAIDTLHAAGKLPEATVAARGAMHLSEHLNGPEHPTTLDTMMWLANLLESAELQRQGGAAHADRPAEPGLPSPREEAAELLMKRFEVLLRAKGPGEDAVKFAHARLVNFLRSVGRTVEANALATLPALREDAEVWRADPADILRLTEQARRELAAGRPVEARKAATGALEAAESLSGSNGPKGPLEIITALARVPLAEAERALGNYGAALEAYEKALAVLQPAGSSAGESAAVVQANMASLYERRGDYPAAERSLLAAEAQLRPSADKTPQAYATVLSNLASLYGSVGRFDEAEKLYARVIAIRETGGADTTLQLALAMSNMATLLYSRHDGRIGEAREWSARALRLTETAHAGDRTHPEIALARVQLAALVSEDPKAGDLNSAETLARQALTALQARLPPQHPDLAHALNTLAAILELQGRNKDARVQIEEAIALAAKAYGTDHPDTVLLRANLARLAVRDARWKDAMRPLREAVQGAARKSRNFARSLQSRPTGGRISTEAQQIEFWMSMLVKIAHRAEPADGNSRDAAMREAFTAAQWSTSPKAASALAEMAARGASGRAALAALVRERQDSVMQWQDLDQSRAVQLALPIKDRDLAAERQWAERRAALERRIGEIDDRLRADFKRYAELTAPDALPIDSVQAALAPDEALVLIAPTEALRPMPEETFVWVITRTEARWVHVEAGKQVLSDYVAALRCGLDDAAWRKGGDHRCAELLKVGKPGKDEPLPFSPGIAHELYETLFGQVRNVLEAKKHLLIVPTGALARLPFQVLVTEPPQGDGLASVRWLARDKAVTILPSVSTLETLRRVAQPSAATKPMIGFGNPLLDGWQADPVDGPEVKQLAAAARERTGCAASPIRRTAAQRGTVDMVPQTGGLAKLDHVRVQPPLPETADELCAVARDLNAELDELRLGARATEKEVKKLSASGDLAHYRVVHFATHGALAGQISGTTEPGLILTPPATATAEDDGYLSLSEITGLKLDADWVILSACNTAGAADKAPSGEALSGVTRAFFYAGARALLVSHWAVDTGTTVKLISGAASESSRNPGIGRAEALRLAMLALIERGDEIDAHPANWAPFVVVGEGGAGR